ncbi:Bmp-binding endothelial regulator protein-like, partial [Plakobranchus ocellatus]
TTLTKLVRLVLPGTVTACDTEGEMVLVPGITDDQCVNCFCKNGQVKCDCPPLEGCHAILFDDPDRCKYRGQEYESGISWLDPNNPCKQLSCRAGVVTVSRVRCFTPCYRTLPPAAGQCCPACEGCYFRGKTYSEGEIMKLPTDSCTSCRCTKGNLVCERQQCPVLNCPASVIYQPLDECCPTCRGKRHIYDVSARCYFAKELYQWKSIFRPTECAKCVCKPPTSICKTKTCPALDCPVAERIPMEGYPCCQKCVQKRPCQFAGKTYKHRESWLANICMGCSCDDGKTYCSREKCNNSLWCPPGYRLQLSRKQCCPRCVEHDAVCSVFGDPHYRTFDGLTYSFQGTCKYILARTCTSSAHSGHKHKPSSLTSARVSGGPDTKKVTDDMEENFLIKVRNGVRFSSGFAWTQMLVVLVGRRRISLLQGGVVKVDRRRVRRMPHSEPGRFSITRAGGIIKFRTTSGLQVSWDGDSFAEVTVTTKFKFKVCGLCGNYNGVKEDDLQGLDGTLYATGQEMGHTWRIGGTRACKSRPRLVNTESKCSNGTQALQRAHRVCSVLYGRAFSRCRQVVKVDEYVRSCVTDMCDCPIGSYCACEVIRAYMSQCSRSGAKVRWDRLSDFCHKRLLVTPKVMYKTLTLIIPFNGKILIAEIRIRV